MEVGTIQNQQFINSKKPQNTEELVIDKEEIKSILYLGIKAFPKEASQEKNSSISDNHAIDKFA